MVPFHQSVTTMTIMKAATALLILLSTTSASAWIHCPYQRAKRAAPLRSFDFGSAYEWDRYYRTSEAVNEEWHATMDLQTIVDLVSDDVEAGLLIGCGYSRLPKLLKPTQKWILLDSSKQCISDLSTIYHDSPNIECLCADVTNLPEDLRVDVILDKGLLDALLCSEGWDGPVSKLMCGAGRALNDKGEYLLVSYPLPSTTKDFLVDASDELEWEFKLEGSTDRVSLSRARKAAK